MEAKSARMSGAFIVNVHGEKIEASEDLLRQIPLIWEYINDDSMGESEECGIQELVQNHPDVSAKNFRIVLEWCQIHINTPMIPVKLPIRKDSWVEMMVCKQGKDKADRTEDMLFVDKYFVEVDGDKFGAYMDLMATAHALLMTKDLLILLAYRFAHQIKFMTPKAVEDMFGMTMPTDPDVLARVEKVLEEIIAAHQKKQAEKAAAAAAAAKELADAEAAQRAAAAAA